MANRPLKPLLTTAYLLGDKAEGRVRVTPEVATALLEKNTSNRPLSNSVVASYARQMREGIWRYNPQDSIVVHASGRLLNGQHRLWAVVESGVPVDLHLVVTDDDSLFKLMDVGYGRTSGHILSIEGVKNAVTVAAGAKMLYTYDTFGWGAAANFDTVKVFPQEIEAVLERYPEVHKAASLAVGHLRRARQLLGSGIFIALLVLFSRKDPDAALEFMRDLNSGANLEVDDPVYHLRDILMDARANPRKSNIRYRHKAALAIKAWNFRRKGKAVAHLRWGGYAKKKREEFPEIL